MGKVAKPFKILTRAAKAVGKGISSVLGVDVPDMPPVVQAAPEADASAAAAEAAGTAAQARTMRRRRARAASLLETGGMGDLASPTTGLPVAGKPTLGA